MIESFGDPSRLPSIRVVVSIEIEAARYVEQERNGNERAGLQKTKPLPPLFIAEKRNRKFPYGGDPNTNTAI